MSEKKREGFQLHPKSEDLETMSALLNSKHTHTYTARQSSWYVHVCTADDLGLGNLLGAYL